jgi:dCTP deaminase
VGGSVSVLIGSELLKRMMEDNPADRLVIGPLFEPMEQLSSTQASVDVRLGCEFRLASASNIGVLDPFAGEAENHFADLAGVYRNIYVPLGGAVTVHPHQLLLATTMEWVRLPPDLMAYVIGRSSLGRLGLIIATAIGVHPGYYGTITLEIRNLGEAPVRLYPGQTVAQLFFHELRPSASEPDLWPQSQGEVFGQYSGAIDPIPRRIAAERSTARLRKLCRKYGSAQKKLHGISAKKRRTG